MIDLFKLASKRHDEIVKEAAFGAVASMFGRAALSAGKAVMKRPLTALGAGLTGADVIQRSSDMYKAQRASRAVADGLSHRIQSVGV